MVSESGLTKTPIITTVDPFGNALAIKEGDRTEVNTYDLQGDLISKKLENGVKILYSRNPKGQITSKSFDGQTTHYKYSNGNIALIERPDGETYTYSYDNVRAKLKNVTLPSGKQISYDYDKEGKLLATKVDNLTKYKYEYSPTTGEVTSVQLGDESKFPKTYSVVKEENKTTHTVSDYFKWNQALEFENVGGVQTNLLSSLTTDKIKVSHKYDSAKRNHSTTVEDKKWTFRHNEDGKIIQILMPEQSGENLIQYNEFGAMSSWSAIANDTQITSEQYSYDVYGNLSGLKKDGVTTNYTYDVMNQLIKEETSQGKINTYDYDKRGNRISINGEVVADFDNSNRLINFKNEKVSYNNDGQRIKDSSFDYEWDGLGRLTKIQKLNGSGEWEFLYDELGRRIEKRSPSGTVRFHYEGDSNRLLAETDAEGKIIREYIYSADGILIGLRIKNELFSYHRNYRGDVVAISDFEGNIAARYTYDEWGNSLEEEVLNENLEGQPIRYASYYYDKDLKLYYLMARYYDPEKAVFLSVDALLELENSLEMFNGYSYVGNNPLIKVDSSGNHPVYIIVYGIVLTYKVYKQYKNFKKIKTLAKSANLARVGTSNRALKVDLQFFAKKNAKKGNFKRYDDKQLAKKFGISTNKIHDIKEQILNDVKIHQSKAWREFNNKNPDIGLDDQLNIQLIPRGGTKKPLNTGLNVADFIF